MGDILVSVILGKWTLIHKAKTSDTEVMVIDSYFEHEKAWLEVVVSLMEGYSRTAK